MDTSWGRNDKRNLGVLFFAQATIGSQLPMHIILGGLAGALLAPTPALATLPISVVVLMSMFTAPVASMLMGRFGRRLGFLLGALAGIGAASTVIRALFTGSFVLLVAGSALFGIAQSVHAFYRFAAADAVTDSFKPKAISIVFGGGLVSALLGPELVQRFGGALLPVQFAGAYAAIVVLNVVGIVILLLLRMPPPVRRQASESGGRPLSVIFKDPRVLAAVVCGTVSYAVMSLVMTSTPLAMVAHGFTSDHAADVVRWHVVSMFAPSFFTGALIARFGYAPIIGLGLVCLAICAGIALAGVDLHKFYLALIMLGVGWNFGFVGATSLLASAHTMEEQARVQGLNDFILFGCVAVASFSSGALLNGFGWNAVQYAALPAVGIAAVMLVWFALPRRQVRVQAPE